MTVAVSTLKLLKLSVLVEFEPLKSGSLIKIISKKILEHKRSRDYAYSAPHSCCYSQLILPVLSHCPSLSVMVIGFTERRRTVSEGLVTETFEFPLFIDVATLRVSEREHRVLHRVYSSGTATVVSLDFRDNLDYDARFGNVQADPIEQEDRLLPGRDSLPLQRAIRNDFVLEDEECYSIRLSPIDIPGLRELFICDFVDTSSTPPMSFFCEHTICIEDDDGNINVISTSIKIIS